MNPSENPNSTPPALPTAALETPVAALPARRRLLRAGLMGAPALLALKSTPVLACNCKLPSGFSASGNLSKNNGQGCKAPALKPSAWSGKVVSGKYSGTSITPGTKFKDAGFGIKYFAATDTFSTVLAKGNTNLAALTAAAYLESFTTPIEKFATTTMIKAMWNNGVVSLGGYTVTTGVIWREAEVRKYLLYATGQTPA